MIKIGDFLIIEIPLLTKFPNVLYEFDKQPLTQGCFEISKLDLREPLGIESVFEGVGIARLRPPRAFGHGEIRSVCGDELLIY